MWSCTTFHIQLRVLGSYQSRRRGKAGSQRLYEPYVARIPASILTLHSLQLHPNIPAICWRCSVRSTPAWTEL